MNKLKEKHQMMTVEDLRIVAETQRTAEQLDKWFKKLDKESHNNLFNLVKRQDQIKTMKVKEYYKLVDIVNKYVEEGSDFHRNYNILVEIDDKRQVFNLIIKDKFVIQLNVPDNKIEVRLNDISTIYGTHVIYKPPYLVSAREIVETIKETLNVK